MNPTHHLHIALAPDEFEMLLSFIQDAQDQLDSVEEQVLAMEGSPDESGPVQSVFRLVHTIKGTSGFFSLVTVERLGHRLENLLDQVRQGKRVPDSDLTDCLLAGFDRLRSLVVAALTAARAPVKEGGQILFDIEEPDINDILVWIEEEAKKSGQAVKVAPPAATPTRWELPPEFRIPPSAPCAYRFSAEQLADFIQETGEQLENVEKGLPRDGPADLDAIMRAFHTIKGNAGLYLAHIENLAAREGHVLNRMRILAHAGESLMQERRDRPSGGSAASARDGAGAVGLSSSDRELLLRVADALAAFSTAFTQEEPGPEITGLVRACLDPDRQTAREEVESPDQTALTEAAIRIAETVRLLEIERPKLDDAEKRTLALDTILSALSDLLASLSMAGLTEMHEDADGIVNIITFLTGDWSVNSELLLLPEIEAFLARLKAFTPHQAPSTRRDAATAGALDAPVAASPTPPPATSVVKVPQERLDKISNLIGELLVSRNTLVQLARNIHVEEGRPDIAAKVKEMAGEIGRQSEELQALIMTVRLMPVQQIFSKFIRLVRELANKLEKKIRLETEGGEIELDRKIIEAINDPLVHLIRNSVDHGIETTTERQVAGKPQEAIIRLRAYTDGQKACIEIIDDGRGLDPEKIRRKAIANGMMNTAESERLSRDALCNLIFSPGFSLAAKVTEVSGRGVGMDVVRRNIEGVNGSISLQSTLGAGTTVSLHLPLSFAVSRGLEVGCDGERFFLPLENVLETVKTPAEAMHWHRDESFVFIRNEILPVRDLSLLLGLTPAGRASGTLTFVIVNVRGRRVALRVCRVMREAEFVLKAIPGVSIMLPWVLGAMITAAGKLILVVDPAKL